jgi:hypothetical protein
MAANDMTDAFQNPHPGVPFAIVGDYTIKALADLAEIFKHKLQQTPSLVTPASPAKVVQQPRVIPLPTQMSNSPMPDRRQTRSQKTIHTPDIPDRPLPPRVVTPRTLRHSPRRVPTGSQQLSPRNLSQDDFCGMDAAHMAIPSEINIGHNGTMPTQSSIPIANHFGPEVLATNADACSRAFETFQEPTHVSSSR